MDTLLNRISQLESAMAVHAKNNVTDEDPEDIPDGQHKRTSDWGQIQSYV